VSGVDPTRPESWPVAQQSALAAAVRATVIADSSHRYGYAVLSGGEVTVEAFEDAESMRRALAAVFTNRDRWAYPLSWEAVLFFEPEEPLRLHLVIELDDDLDDGEVNS